MRALWALALTTPLLLSACEANPRAPKISGAWSPATAPSVTVGAAYMRIRSDRADMLTGATTPVADKVEMHTSFRIGAVARMRQLDSLALSPHVTYTFAPGGMHFMLVGLHEPLTSDSKYSMTLHFREAGDVKVMVPVTAPGAGPPAD